MKLSIRLSIIPLLLIAAFAFASPIPKLQPAKGNLKAEVNLKEMLAPAPNTAGWGNWRLCNDTAEDIEPAIIRAYRSNPQGNPIDTTMVAYMKRFANGKYRLNALFTDGDTYVPNPGPLPLPSPYTTSADPIVTANPYNDGTNPRTYYVIGTAQAYTESGGALENSIMLWWLRDGELTWQRTTLATNTDPQYFADKPWVTAEWDAYNRGWIWATYVRVNINGSAPNTIYLYRSIDGANYAQLPVTVTGFGIHSPTVLVDSSNSTVYLMWISYTDNKIYIATVLNGGLSLSTPIGFDAGSTTQPLLGPGVDLITDSSNVAVLARSLLHARYNSVDHSIGVVWHRRETVTSFVNQTKTDVYFNSFSTTTSQWRGVKKVNDSNSVNDQWNGALDFDQYGHYVVAWYDRRDDPNNRQYAVYATMLTATGDRMESTDVQISAGRPGYNSDPTAYEPYTGRNAILLGEYHDIWSWYDTVNSRMVWNTGDVDIYYGQGDVWNDQVQP